jgi:methylated-DNA-protein-cysteine methyltransferase-like protein
MPANKKTSGNSTNKKTSGTSFNKKKSGTSANKKNFGPSANNPGIKNKSGIKRADAVQHRKSKVSVRHATADDGNLREIQPSGRRDQSFFELVYEVARQIPYGRVTSYGAIAACLGTRLSARMVGYAMNGADKINPSVPAHRVVNRVGLLSGKHHFKPPGKMEKLLRKEGILVKDDTIVNFKEKFWDPGKAEDLGI